MMLETIACIPLKQIKKKTNLYIFLSSKGI